MSAVAGRSAFHPDLNKLLQPIRPDAPSGDYLLYEGTYDKIREARREDEQETDRGVWKQALKKADWGEVERICRAALETRTHDLQIAGWLADAWLHLHGFTGFREGLKLIARMCENYWDTLHPMLDKEDSEYRYSPLIWLDERLSFQLTLLPITRPDADDLASYSLADWEFSCRPHLTSSQSPTGITQGRVKQSVMLTPSTFLLDMHRSVETSLRAVQQMRELLAGFSPDAPTLHQLAAVLDRLRQRMVSFLAERNESPEGPPATVLVAERSTDGPDGSPAGAGADAARQGTESGTAMTMGGIRSRTEAYARLAEVAEYLSRTEPHSPTPYLIRRAVAWGSMRLDELLPELVRTQTDLVEIFKLLSISRESPDNS